MTYGIAAYKVTPQFCEDEVEFITIMTFNSLEDIKAFAGQDKVVQRRTKS